MNTLSLFDNRGEVGDVDPAEVEKLSPEDQAALVDVLTHCRAAQAHDRLVIETRAAVHAAMQKHDLAVAEDNRLNVPLDPTFAARMAIHANNPSLPPLKPKPLNKKARTHLHACIAELAAIRDDYAHHLVTQKTLNRARGEAIVRWMKTQEPVTPLNQQRAAAANFVPNPVTEVVHRCPIDAAGREAKSRQRTPANTKAAPGMGLPIIRHRNY